MPNQYRKITIIDCQQVAFTRNGKCLSNIYVNANVTMTWMCEFEHIWNATFGNVLHKNKWCPECYGNKKLNIEFARDIAKKYDGKLLSEDYLNATVKMEWQCKLGHIFFKSLSMINYTQSWCPYCSVWSSEEICRVYFETIFNKKFPKVRPAWLLNSRNNRMELDGLSEDFVYDNKYIAFEHQGEQHYTKNVKMGENNYYSNFSLEQRQKDDEDKLKLCNNNNVILIQIPQLIKRTKIKDLNSFIKNECLKFGLDVSQFSFTKKIDISSIHTSDKYLAQIQNIVKLRGGKCISNNYVNAHTKMQIMCENNHLFEVSPNNLKSGTWCPICWEIKRSNKI